MRSASLLLAAFWALGCRQEPTDTWRSDASAEGALDLIVADGDAFGLQLTFEGDLAEDAYIDTGGHEVTAQPEAQSFLTAWRLELVTSEAGHGPLRVLFYSDTDPMVPAVTDIAADSQGGSPLRFDSWELECVFEPATWNVCTQHMRVQVERRDARPTTLTWTLSAWAEGEGGTASLVEEARLSLVSL